MSTAVATISTSYAVPATAADIKAQVQRIQQVMKAVMKEGIHYGKVPGTTKPSLWKPGAEVLCATFHIAPVFRIEDLSTSDAYRYRITCVGSHQGTGVMLGEGLGACSSSEEKYKWRAAVCDEEFADTDEDRRRVKWKRGNNGTYKLYQIRAEPDDIDNTVLKMASKRAHIAMTLGVTAASDIFAQDLEDIPAEMLGEGDDQGGQQQQQPAPRGKPATQAPQRTASNGNGQRSGGGIATAKQIDLVRMKAERAGISAEDLCKRFKIDSLVKLPFDQVNAVLAFISDPDRERERLAQEDEAHGMPDRE